MTAEQAAAIASAIDDKASVSFRRGTFAGVNANKRALVTIGESQVAVDFVSSTIPEIGEVVHLWTVGNQVFMAGPVLPKPGFGTVVSVSAPKVTVSTVIGNITMPYVGTAPAVTNFVAISWSEGPVAVGVLSTSPAAIPPPSPGSGGATTYSAVFYATDTGSTDRPSARWWTDQPWASNSTYGAWFYGFQLKDSIPASATLVSLEFYASYVQRQGGVPNFALHNQAIKAGLPSFGASTGWAPADGWNVPPDPAGWFAALKAGGGSYGIGLDQGGYNKFASRTQDGLTGALRITWKA